MSADHVDLLQFHWQDYNDYQYIQALQILQEDERVRHLGLCNFDTARLQEVIDRDIDIVTNQVQFSLIDARPRFQMGEVCEQQNVKLLTYGTLCGKVAWETGATAVWCRLNAFTKEVLRNDSDLG